MLSNGYDITRRIEAVSKSFITKNANLLTVSVFSLFTAQSHRLCAAGNSVKATFEPVHINFMFGLRCDFSDISLFSIIIN